MATLLVSDETATGASLNQWTIEEAPDLMSVREIICLRVREEVARHNLSADDRYQGLVSPTWTEATVNGANFGRRVDWEHQAEVAVRAFERNGFFILVDDHQPTSLDELIDLRRAERVSFVRLVPLAGG